MAETQYILTVTKQGKKEYIPLPSGGVAPHNQAWSTITDTPTTLAGYGITDGGGAMEWPGAGIPLSTGSSPWGTSYSTTGSGNKVALQTDPVFTGTVYVASELRVSSPGAGVFGSLLDVASQKIESGSTAGYRTAVEIYGGSASPANTIKFIAGSAEKARIDDTGFGINCTPSLLFHVVSKDNTTASFVRFAAANLSQAVEIHYNGLRSGGTNAAVPLYLDSKGSGDVIIQSVGSGNIGIGFTSPLAKVSINGGLHVGGASNPGDNNLWVDGIAQEPNFISGWQGNNWRIEADGDAEFNNVLIRGGLSVYELIINQLHYQNGGLIIGAGAGKIATIETATAGSEVLTFHDPEGNDMVPFTAGAIVMCQRVDISKTVANGYTGDVVKKIVRQVASVSGMEVTLTTTAGWTTGDDTGVFEVGDELCAIGHTSNTSLDSALYLSATDSDNPFLRVMDGVSSYAKWSLGDKTTCKLQLGNLASLASYDIIPASPGYGIYCDNAYLNGRLVLPSAGMTNEGSSASDIRIYAGESYANKATAPFRVTQDGSLTATGVAELGTATATVEGAATNVAIMGPDIWENAYNGSNGLHINRLGYNGGSTQYKEFTVWDGKSSGKLLTVVGGATDVVNLGNPNNPRQLLISMYGNIDKAWGNQFVYAYSGVSNTDILLDPSVATYTETGTNYVLKRTITLGAYIKPNRTLRIRFDLKADTNTSYARIYKNGSAVGTERITSSITDVTYYEDIAGWNAGDTVELYMKSTSGNTATASHFAICGNMVTTIQNEITATYS